MPSESRNRSACEGRALSGSLAVCLVDGDAKRRRLERRVRWRALLISVFSQGAFLGALLLVPVLGRSERVAFPQSIYTPLPPYGRTRHVPQGDRTRRTPPTKSVVNGVVFPLTPARPRPQTPPVVDGTEPSIAGLSAEEHTPGPGPVCTWCVPSDKESGPRPKRPEEEPSHAPQLVHFTQLDPALLMRRVEPIYPPLAKQTHKEGRVELHAIIASDGSIQSLEIVGGDPLFFASAAEAVRQWRYKPTILNGQPVEIDTHITVIYTLQH